MNFRSWLFQENYDFSNYHPEDQEEIRQIVQRFDSMYPLAGPVVAGLKVRADIPNQSSIGASVDDYQILRGVRQFPLHGFGGARTYYNARDYQHCMDLAQQIATNREINPVIIVEEKQGPYILEGGHRVAALVELKIPEVPAMIVIDIDSFFEN